MSDIQPSSAVIIGALGGALYFLYGEAGQEKESNCSYLAPAETDAAALAAAGILVWQARVHTAPWVAFVGGAIGAIHLGQYLHFKTTLTGREEVGT